jgi:glycosyltransferase involved in cell wall biosynthesis
MEAISCGIPAIATDVGGNKEIVSEKNGYLIAANPSPEQIADALLSCWDDPGERRAGSLQVWMQGYDAKRNYSDFVQQLVQIRA